MHGWMDKKYMDGWMAKKMEKNRWMDRWIEKNIWMAGRMDLKKIYIWMVGRIKNNKKQMDGWKGNKK